MAKSQDEIIEAVAASEKLKALQAAMAKIEKDFGKGSIMKLGDEMVENVEVISTGSLALNAALGVGGYPKGRIIEIYGPESSGKTTLAIHAIAEAQKNGGIAAFIDAEHAFDRFYAAKLGVNVDELLISQPDNGEEALEIADQLIRSSAIDIIDEHTEVIKLQDADLRKYEKQIESLKAQLNNMEACYIEKKKECEGLQGRINEALEDLEYPTAPWDETIASVVKVLRGES